jgi:hypothetical protein
MRVIQYSRDADDESGRRGVLDTSHPPSPEGGFGGQVRGV